MDYPVQWDIIVEILGLILALVHNDGWDQVLPTSLVKVK